MRTPFLILLAHAGLIVSLHGQGASRLSTPNSDPKKQLQEAAEKLRQAQGNGDLEKVKGTAKELLKKLPSGVTDAAKAAVQSPEVKAQAVDAVKAAAETMIPQARALLNQPDQTATPAAAPAPAAVQDQPPAAPQGPRPQALAPIGGSPQKVSDQPTVIIEADSSVFDLKAGIFLYSGHVRARHPDFYIECEELEVHMVKDEASKDGKKPAPKPANDPVVPDQKNKVKDSPILKAIARGPMVTIEKRDENGQVQLGKCRRLDYDKASGDITLSDYPQVQRGNILHKATQADTTMVFDKNGKLRTNGRPRTVILSDQEPAADAPANKPNAQ